MNHKDLDAWKMGITLVKEVYQITKSFPPEERYGLTSQIRRCAVSIPSNIAEGAARNSNKDMSRFLYISLGSLAELETQIIIAKELKFSGGIKEIIEPLQRTRKLIVGLIKYLERKA